MNKKSIFSLILAVGLCAATFAANTVGVYKSNAVASYYADKFHGRKTANGEIFDMYALTAAHKSLPFNTMVKVTNLDNGKSVVVRINDRGPFVAGREIDVSKAAASKLGMLSEGTAHVSLQILGEKENPVSATPVAAKSEELDFTTAQHWDVQLAAFSSRMNAEIFAKKAQRSGIKNLAYQTTKDVTRVIIRDLATEEVAPLLELLESKGYTDYLVKERRD
ncbi:MAG: septal ring lytic transglycosylase RlpA family protein [Treponemataceae bacterium]|nr:septal ring lytic transglycosylase RlpA family protein [Treponemataceae bacterium]